MYNNCNWKGNVLKVQMAKEDFLSRSKNYGIIVRSVEYSGLRERTTGLIPTLFGNCRAHSRTLIFVE